jgi:hypothetical protein
MFYNIAIAGLWDGRVTIRRLRCASPPVIHHAAASAAILLSQNKNSTDILQKIFGQMIFLEIPYCFLHA